MSITVNFEVASAPKRNGLYPVFLRVTENSKHYKMSLGVFVQNRKNFNPHAKHKAWIAAKEPLFKVYINPTCFYCYFTPLHLTYNKHIVSDCNIGLHMPG